jgi:hypothetical protein
MYSGVCFSVTVQVIEVIEKMAPTYTNVCIRESRIAHILAQAEIP